MKTINALFVMLLANIFLTACKKDGNLTHPITNELKKTSTLGNGGNTVSMAAPKHTPEILYIQQYQNTLSIAVLKPKHSNILSINYRPASSTLWYSEDLLYNSTSPSSNTLPYIDGSADELNRVCYTFDIPFNQQTGSYCFQLNVAVSNHDTNTTDYESAYYNDFSFTRSNNTGGGIGNQMANLEFVVTFQKSSTFTGTKDFTIKVNNTTLVSQSLSEGDFNGVSMITKTYSTSTVVMEGIAELKFSDEGLPRWQGFYSGSETIPIPGITIQ